MRTVWKYRLTSLDDVLQIPRGYEVLHVGLDPLYTPCVWAMVDPDAPVADVRIVILGTGQSVPEGELRHIGS